MSSPPLSLPPFCLWHPLFPLSNSSHLIPRQTPHRGNHILVARSSQVWSPILYTFISPISVLLVSPPWSFYVKLCPLSVARRRCSLSHYIEFEPECLLSVSPPARPQSLALWRLRPSQPGTQTYWQVSEKVRRVVVNHNWDVCSPLFQVHFTHTLDILGYLLKVSLIVSVRLRLCKCPTLLSHTNSFDITTYSKINAYPSLDCLG